MGLTEKNGLGNGIHYSGKNGLENVDLLQTLKKESFSNVKLETITTLIKVFSL
jgi:hypothetical protein